MLNSLSVAAINPMKLKGPWIDGYVLDFHSISSTPTGDPYHPFDTKRTELGELVYRLKYRVDAGALADIVQIAGEFVKKWNPPVECIVPAPPSLQRKSQPVVEITRESAKYLDLITCENAVAKVHTTPQMKNVPVWERQETLQEAIQPGHEVVEGKSVLLFDDLIESGSTLRRTAEVLMKDRGAASIYALVLTRTR